MAKLTSPTEIDTLSADDMYDWVRAEYFRNTTADQLGTIRKLAALAQFEIEPRADLLPIPDDEYQLIESFCIRSGRPSCWCFLHSSAAELILHSLWAGMGVGDPLTVAEYAATVVIDYLSDIQSDRPIPPVPAGDLVSALTKVIKGQLILAGKEGEVRCKAKVLDSESVQALLSRLAKLPSYHRTDSLCTMVAHNVKASSVRSYAKQLFDLLNDATSTTPNQPIADQTSLGFMFRTLKLAHQSQYDALMEKMDWERIIIKLIEANGTVSELFKIIEYASPKVAHRIVDAPDEKRVARLIRTTVAGGRSIGTLNLSLRALQGTDPESAEALEEKIGAVHFLELIETNGTVCELFNIIQNASPPFARRMVDTLDEELVKKLIKKTVAVGRSIGTLGLTLRALQATAP